MNDVVCGLPLKMDGSIDWALLTRCWKLDAAIGPIHDCPRPVRKPFDPRSESDMIIYGEALVWVNGRVVSLYR